MHKKKVLFMINSMYGGGAEKIFQTLLNNLEPSKYDITVYSVNQCKIDHKYYPENIKYKYAIPFVMKHLDRKQRNQEQNNILRIYNNI